MWQLSWMLSLLPDWFWWSVLILGGIALAASWLSTPYKVPLKVGGLIGIFVGTFMVGMAANEAKWVSRVKELEDKLLIAENESKKESVVIQEKIVYKDRVIKEKSKKQIEYIDRIVKGDTEVITKDMSEEERTAFKKKQEELENALRLCPVPQIIIEEHNKAAKGMTDQLNKAAKGDKK